MCETKEIPLAFSLGHPPSEHRVDNIQCDVGWCDAGGHFGFPKKCVCGGLIHAEFEDESLGGEDGETIHLSQGCDQCGEDYEEADS